MYGINCGPSKFQRKIENIISGIAVFIDGIQLTEKGLFVKYYRNYSNLNHADFCREASSTNVFR